MTSYPSGRSGPLDGLPSGQRTAATYRDTTDPGGCYHANRYCRGPQVTVHTMTDHPNGGTMDYDRVTTCLTHAVVRHRLHPGGEPTDAYRQAVHTA